MVSLRFPFSFPQPSKPPNSASMRSSSHSFSYHAAVVGLSMGAVGAGIAISQNLDTPFFQNVMNILASNFSLARNSFTPMWGSISLQDNLAPVTESKTGMSFPAVLRDSQHILGVGLRKKAILGLKNIDVYAYGVYADKVDVNKFLGSKEGNDSTEKQKGNIDLEALMESDVSMTIRLQIVYGRLSIRSVRNAFEDSVGSRLQKFGGEDNKELLQRFTSQFKDAIKIPRGSIIDLSKEPGYVLRTFVEGEELGNIKSKLLCQSILDLYIGRESFDEKARDAVLRNLPALIEN